MPDRFSKIFLTRTGIGGVALLLAGAGGYWARAVADPSHMPLAEASSAPVNAKGALAAPGGPSGFADIVAKVAPAVVSIDVVKTGSSNVIVLGPQGLPFGYKGPGQNGGPSQNGRPGQSGGSGQNGGTSQNGGPFGFEFQFPQMPTRPTPLRASGSGFFISPDGYIVTNDHVVEGAQKITVRTNDDRSFTAVVVGRDPATDLAVIRVSGGPFQYVSFEDRAMPRVGDWVVAVGNPFGLGGTATAGIVSALGRQDLSGSSYVNFMQIDAPINQGNSGGPTFDVEGRVVGVNSAIFTPSGGSVGIGFDIPADVADSVTKQLIASGHITRGYIGATIQSLTPELADSLGVKSDKGAIVSQLVDGGPAAGAGLRTGDVVVGVDGRAISSASDLTRQVALAKPGDTIRLAVLRDGGRRDVEVRSGSRPAEPTLANDTPTSSSGENEPAGAILGMQLSPNPNGGLVVQDVSPNSDAGAKGLQDGDVLLRAGDRSLNSPADLAAAAADARRQGRKDLPLFVARADTRFFVPVQVGAG